MELFTLATMVEPDRSMGFTATVIIAGLGIVLATLAILIIVFYLFGKMVSKTQGAAMKKNKKKIEKREISATPVSAFQAPVAVAPAAEQGIPGEVVAAISAAVYMMEGEGAVVSAIAPAVAARRQLPNPVTRRNPWAMAAVVQNTKPF